MKKRYLETSLFGDTLLNCPQLNKGTAFNEEERNAFDLHGKLPFKVETLDQQVERVFMQYRDQPDDLKKNIFLHELHMTNQTLFFRLVSEHVEEILPILYTPQVAEAIKELGNIFRRPFGLYISYPNKHQIAKILQNESHREIDLIVVTDGERILGIGDQGINGIQIPIAKSMLYTLFGGISPLRTLPIVLDVGTNNKRLLNDPFYLGWRHRRLEKDAYFFFIDDFIATVQKIFPKVFLHWEDFSRDNALSNLQRFRKALCSFNDDIQGTAVVTTAALLMALKKTRQKLVDQRIVILGAGSSGIGISELVCMALVNAGKSLKKSKSHLWLLDRNGLLTENSPNITPAKKKYLRCKNDITEWGITNPNHICLEEVVANVKPTVLIGCSGSGGAFNERIIKNLASQIENPIILPLSNPTQNSEANPRDLIEWTNGRALIATGSPFSGFSQCNNALAFPGLGLAVSATKAKEVTNSMLWVATQALLEYTSYVISPEDNFLLPPMSQAHETAKRIAFAVAKQIHKEKLTELPNDADLEEIIKNLIWQPEYLSYRRIY